MTKEERLEYERIKDLHDVAEYVNRNGGKSMNEFLCELMADVRSGAHVEWYDRLFADADFVKFVKKCCWLRGMDNLYITLTSLKLQMSLLKGCAEMNAVGGGRECSTTT